MTTWVEPETGEKAQPEEELWLNPIWGTITSSCGLRQSPILGKWEMHNGVDIAASIGTEAVAVKSGVVTETRTSATFGKLVKYETTDGYTVMFAHLSEILVEEGQQINQGAVIAKTGNTGWSTGPHLHYSVWREDTLLDPLAFLYLPYTDEVVAEYTDRGAAMP